MPGRQFRQLDEAVLGGGGIEKGDAAAGVADTRHLVEQWNPLPLQFRKRFVDILDLEADMIEPALALRDHARVLAVGRRSGDQLDHGSAHRIQREPPLRILLHAAQRDAETILPEPPARFGVPHYHANVLDALDLHGYPPGRALYRLKP